MKLPVHVEAFQRFLHYSGLEWYSKIMHSLLGKCLESIYFKHLWAELESGRKNFEKWGKDWLIDSLFRAEKRRVRAFHFTLFFSVAFLVSAIVNVLFFVGVL